MKKQTVMTVFGTRPEAIKMAPLALALGQDDDITPLCCVTGQHRQMLDDVLDVFGVKPDFDLDIMEPSQTPATITSKVLLGLDGVFEKTQPDLVLVHGDTTTSFAAALSAFYHKIPVGHVEAGLRTFDRYSPFPEEINRQCTGRLAELHFCPTARNKLNLANEGIKSGVYITGNTVIDALRFTVSPGYSFENPLLCGLDWDGRRVILLTAHRRENYGKPFEEIFQAVVRLADMFEDTEFVYPVHLSPYVRETARRFLSGHRRIHLTEPLGPREMHNAMARCYMVMTDSGGLQEEAPALGKPVLVLRQETERPEAVDAGTVKIAGVVQDNIVNMGREILSSRKTYSAMARAVNPYGDGHACERIVQAVKHALGSQSEPPEDFTP